MLGEFYAQVKADGCILLIHWNMRDNYGFLLSLIDTECLVVNRFHPRISAVRSCLKS